MGEQPVVVSGGDLQRKAADLTGGASIGEVEAFEP
jgi:hypothetical protein